MTPQATDEVVLVELDEASYPKYRETLVRLRGRQGSGRRLVERRGGGQIGERRRRTAARRTSHARPRLLKLVEHKARDLGANKVELHDFGHNHAARALYEKTDYYVTSIIMAKPGPAEDNQSPISPQ